MAEQFPIEIAQCFLLSGFQQQQKPNVIRTEIEAGTAKLRRRYTQAVINVTGGIVVDQAQLQIFNYFYDVTLQSGVQRFLFDDPTTQTEKEYRFVSPPMIKPLVAGQWSIEMELEIVP